jgi:Mg-chelatase subunit ChlD
MVLLQHTVVYHINHRIQAQKLWTLQLKLKRHFKSGLISQENSTKILYQIQVPNALILCVILTKTMASFFSLFKSTPAPAATADSSATNETPSTSNADSKDKSKLDLVFLCDCTGSMGSYIAAAQQSITDIITKITDSNKVDVQFAVIGYEDHCDPQLLHQYPWTANVNVAQSYVSKLRAGGGGDAPEAVEDALKAALDLEYRDGATKIVITVSDAPPHGLGNINGDSYPDGCPLGVDALAVVRQMVDKDIIIYSVGCEPALSSSAFSRAFFKMIATVTGGQYVPLSDAQSLPKVIIYGAEEEIQLAKYAAEIEAEDKVVREELSKQKEELGDKFEAKSDDEVLQIVTDRLAARGVKLETLKVTDQTGEELKEKSSAEQEEDELVSLMSDLSTMSEVRELLKTRSPAQVPVQSYAAPPMGYPMAPTSYASFPTSSAPMPSYAASFDDDFAGPSGYPAPAAPAAYPSAAVADIFAPSFASEAAAPVPTALPSASPSARAAFAPAPAASFSSAPVSYGYAQEMSSLNVSQVKRVMNRSKNKSSNH